MKPIVSAICAIGCVVLLASQALGVEITFREEAEVRSSTLRIGDIADISPAEKARDLADLALFSAPAHGEERCYRSATLRAYVRDAVRGQAGPESIIFGGADAVCIRHGAMVVEDNEIVGVINEHLESAIGHMGAQKLRFVPRNTPEALSLPDGDVDFEVIFPNPDVISSRQATLIVRVDGRVRHNISVPGKIQAFVPVVVTAGNLGRGDVIDAGDVRVELKNLNGLKNPVTDKQDAIGMKLRRPLSVNRVISENDLDLPVLVERRQMITLVANRGALEITTKGQAMASGRRGDIVMIKNLRSDREVPGRVIGPGLAKVEF